MELSVVGLSHKSAPIEVREKLARLPLEKVYERFRHEGLDETVVLSTCNRFELCLSSGDTSLNSGLTELSEVSPELKIRRAQALIENMCGQSLEPHLYRRVGQEAVLHLFEVAAGLDSLIVGETEILGQVKNSYLAAQSAKMTGKLANVLFQRALYVGKKVRSETGISVGQTSTASVAVQLAETIFGRLSDSAVLILGAGAMAESTARHLQSQKVPKITVSNRTYSRAQELAAKFHAEAIDWDKFPEALKTVDIVISSTGSDHPILTAATIQSALQARAGRSLFVIDIAMPRDVEEAVNDLDHVYLYRMEDLETIVSRNLKDRQAEITRARELVRQKASEFWAWADSVGSGRELSLKHSGAL